MAGKDSEAPESPVFKSLRAFPADDQYAVPGTVLECRGVESSIITAAYGCRRDGTIKVVGESRSTVNYIPFTR